MAYVDPTPAGLEAAFPAFLAVPQATIQYWIDRAVSVMGTAGWRESDYTHGAMLLAAHYMTMQGVGTGAEAVSAAQGASGFKVMKSGSLTLERFDDGAGGNAYDTSYGRQYLALLRRNTAGPRITGTGTYPVYPAGVR